MRINRGRIPCIVTIMLLLASCGGSNTSNAGDRLQVLATISIIADVVQQVGGEFISVTTLLPLGTDPHEYSPRPKDAADITNADIIFACGAGLEANISSFLENAGGIGKLIEISDGIELIRLGESGGYDPHTWMDPNNVLIWLENISNALSTMDPEHATEYQANAGAYAALLNQLDGWIHTEVNDLPEENRLIVSDHAVFGYFIDEYGFSQVGTITGSFSTEAAPSARELAGLEELIISNAVPVIFVTEPSNLGLAEQIAQDTGTRIVFVYHASLTDESGPASTYLDFMRYNVTAIVDALK